MSFRDPSLIGEDYYSIPITGVLSQYRCDLLVPEHPITGITSELSSTLGTNEGIVHVHAQHHGVSPIPYTLSVDEAALIGPDPLGLFTLLVLQVTRYPLTLAHFIN